MPKKIITVIFLIIASIFIFTRVSNIKELLGAISLNYTLNSLAFIGLIIVTQVISAYRLKILLGSDSDKLDLYVCFDLVATGLVLNVLTLSGAGEVYWVAMLKKLNIKMKTALVGVALGRWMGLLSMLVMLFISFFVILPIRFESISELGLFGISLGSMNKLIIMSALVLLFGVTVLIGYRMHIAYVAVIKALLASMSNTIITICAVYFLMAYFISSTNFWESVFVVTINMLAGFLPISIAGLGVREVGYELLIEQFYGIRGVGVLLGISQFLLYVATALICKFYLKKYPASWDSLKTSPVDNS